MALAPPNGHLGLTQLVEAIVHPPIPGRTAHTGILSCLPKAFPAIKRRPKLGLLVHVYSKMMAVLDQADVGFPRHEPGRGEPQLRRRLARSLAIATPLQVFLAQPAVADLFINASMSGGRFETMPVLYRGKKPDICC